MHHVQHCQPRIEHHEHRRDDREIFGDVVGDREGGERAAGHQQLLAQADHLDQLGRIAVEIDHVARLARGLGAGVHRHADIGLGQSGRVVGAVAAHRDQLAAGLLLADQRQLVLGRRLSEEIVDPGLGRDGGGGERIVAGDHHRADAHLAQLAEALADAGLDHVLERDRAEQAAVARHRERGHARARDLVGGAAQLGRGGGLAEAGIGAEHGIDRALLDQAVADPDARDPGLRGEGDHLCPFGQGSGVDGEALAGEHHHRTPLGRLVGEAGEQGGFGQVGGLDARHGAELARLAIADRDRAGLVEQQRVDVARRLDRAPRFGEHVEAHQPVHAGNADRGQQGGDRGRDERDEQGRQHRYRDRAAGIGSEARHRADRDQEDDREADEQDGERDLVRRLLPLGTLDQGDHAVEEALAGIDRDADLDLVRYHARARGHRRSVAARLADHRRALAGDGGLVDAGDALDHLAVGRDEIAGLDQHDIADAERAGGDGLDRIALEALGVEFGLGGAQARRLRLAAALGQGFGEGAEQHGQPQPDDELQLEADRQAVMADDQQHGQQRRDAGGDEHHRIAHELRRRKLEEGLADRGQQQIGGEERFGGGACHGVCPGNQERCPPIIAR